MPIYEYACKACGHRFEEWQRMSDEPTKVCPKCSQEAVERLISLSSFHLKGGGWYSDLYSSGSKPSGGGSSGGSGPSTGGKSEKTAA